MGVLKIAEVGQGEDGNKIMYGWKMDIWGKIWGRDVGLGGKGIYGEKGWRRAIMYEDMAWNSREKVIVVLWFDGR